MKKLIALSSGALAASRFLVGTAFAALPSPPTIPGLETGTDIKVVLVKVITIILDFVILIAVIFVIVAGIRLIVSGGDEGEKDKAKKTIIYVIVGLIVVLFARVIVVFVNQTLTGGPSVIN